MKLQWERVPKPTAMCCKLHVSLSNKYSMAYLSHSWFPYVSVIRERWTCCGVHGSKISSKIVRSFEKRKKEEFSVESTFCLSVSNLIFTQTTQEKQLYKTEMF